SCLLPSLKVIVVVFFTALYSMCLKWEDFTLGMGASPLINLTRAKRIPVSVGPVNQLAELVQKVDCGQHEPGAKCEQLEFVGWRHGTPKRCPSDCCRLVRDPHARNCSPG